MKARLVLGLALGVLAGSEVPAAAQYEWSIGDRRREVDVGRMIYVEPLRDPIFDVTCSSLTRGYFTFEFALELAEQNFGAAVDVVFAAEGQEYARTGVIAAHALTGQRS